MLYLDIPFQKSCLNMQRSLLLKIAPRHSEQHIKAKNSLNLIGKYKKQIIFLIIAICSILISISVIKILIDIEKGFTTYKKEENKIIKKSKVAALLILISSIYFFSDSVKTYKKNQDRQSLNFIIATFLVLIAATIRIISLFYPINLSSDDEDNFI